MPETRRLLQLDPLVDGFGTDIATGQLAALAAVPRIDGRLPSEIPGEAAAVAATSPSYLKSVDDLSGNSQKTQITGTSGADSITVTTEVSSIKTFGGADMVTIAIGAEV